MNLLYLLNGKYQILSGHLRKECAKELGIVKVPCDVKEGIDDTIAKRYFEVLGIKKNKILPSEMAKALKIKLDVIKTNIG